MRLSGHKILPSQHVCAPSATTIKLLRGKMVRYRLSPIVVRGGTPIGGAVNDSQTVFGRLPAHKAKRATHYVPPLLIRLDAKIGQVHRPETNGAVRPCPKANSKLTPKPEPQANCAPLPGNPPAAMPPHPRRAANPL